MIYITCKNGTKMTYNAGTNHDYCVQVAKEFASFSYTATVVFEGKVYK